MQTISFLLFRLQESGLGLQDILSEKPWKLKKNKICLTHFFHQGKSQHMVGDTPRIRIRIRMTIFRIRIRKKMQIRNPAVEIHKSIDFRCKNISIPTSSLTTSLAFSLASQVPSQLTCRMVPHHYVFLTCQYIFFQEKGRNLARAKKVEIGKLVAARFSQDGDFYRQVHAGRGLLQVGSTGRRLLQVCSHRTGTSTGRFTLAGDFYRQVHTGRGLLQIGSRRTGTSTGMFTQDGDFYRQIHTGRGFLQVGSHRTGTCTGSFTQEGDFYRKVHTGRGLLQVGSHRTGTSAGRFTQNGETNSQVHTGRGNLQVGSHRTGTSGGRFTKDLKIHTGQLNKGFMNLD